MLEHTRQAAVASPVDTWPEQRLDRQTAAEFVFGAPEGSVRVLAGIDSESLRIVLDGIEPGPHRGRALLARISPAATTEAIVEQVIELFAATARRLWPIWFTNVSFGQCRNDTLGRLAANVIARSTAEEIQGLSLPWVEEATRLVLESRVPRVRAAVPAVELAQLALAVSRTGTVLVADVSETCVGPNPAATVHALEWIAQHIRGAVVALFHELPPSEPPFDRILYGARRITWAGNADLSIIAPDPATEGAGPWIAPWQGLPHPLSDVEQRIAKALSADAELGPLFGFNQFVDTVRGSRPKVDLVWTQGRLVVELDGYASHGSRIAFMHDRHRDYELALSGYTVLRLANDEVVQDLEKAIAKIRDLVCLCRTRAVSEE
jgi:very-short-patch-repair endonuclease